jgi:low temperature requirement protein LtrA
MGDPHEDEAEEAHRDSEYNFRLQQQRAEEEDEWEVDSDFGSFLPTDPFVKKTFADELTSAFRSMFSALLVRPHFEPKYIWKDGIIGGVRQYVGFGHEHEEHWTSLFLDLMYVCMCSKVASLLNYCNVDVDMILLSFLFMQSFFSSRFFIDEYNQRFDKDDLFHRILLFAYVVGIAVMLVNVNVDMEDSSYSSYRRGLGAASTTDTRYECKINSTYWSNFVIGFCITRSAIIVLYSGLSFIDQSTRVWHQFSLRLVFFVLAIVMMVVATVEEDVTVKPYFFLVAMLLELIGHLSTAITMYLRRKGWWPWEMGRYHFPINPYIGQERLGIYILVVLGEALILLLTPKWSLDNYDEGYLVIIASIFLIYMFAMQYFDQVQKGEGTLHACRRNVFAGITWIWLHAVLGFSLLLISVAIYGIDTHYDDSEYGSEDTDKKLLCIGCFVSQIIMLTMRMMHKGFRFHFATSGRIQLLVLRLIYCFGHLVIIWIPDLPPKYALLIHAGISFFPVVGDIMLHHIRGEKELNHHRERRRTMYNLQAIRAMMDNQDSQFESLETLVTAAGTNDEIFEEKRKSLFELGGERDEDMSDDDTVDNNVIGSANLSLIPPEELQGGIEMSEMPNGRQRSGGGRLRNYSTLSNGRTEKVYTKPGQDAIVNDKEDEDDDPLYSTRGSDFSLPDTSSRNRSKSAASSTGTSEGDHYFGGSPNVTARDRKESEQRSRQRSSTWASPNSNNTSRVDKGTRDVVMSGEYSDLTETTYFSTAFNPSAKDLRTQLLDNMLRKQIVTPGGQVVKPGQHSTFFNEGESEEEIRQSELYILAGMNIDRSFIDKYKMLVKKKRTSASLERGGRGRRPSTDNETTRDTIS